jgi:TPR repeat protein
VAYEGSVQAPARHGDDFYWVCIEVTFKCRMCAFDVPLNHLDMDGAVLCARCGLEQAFQVAHWREMFAHAQNTGDLWIETAIGESTSSAVLDELGENRVRVTASPGYPRCESCHAQLEIAADDGKTTTSCACGQTASYEIPPAARKVMQSLQAIVAAEHRTDRKAVKVDQNASAIAVACPSCNAPLEANESSKFLTCTFCNTTSRIPDRTWFRISGKDPKAEPMWLLFHGPSPSRVDADYRKKVIEDEEKEKAERKRKRAELEREREAERDEKKRRHDEEEQRRNAAELAEEDARKREKERVDRQGLVFVFGITGAVLVVILVGAWLVSRSKENKPASAIETANSACAAGDGKACVTAADLLDPSRTTLRKEKYDHACNANYAPGCTKRAELSSGDTAVDYYQRGCQGGDKPACDALEKLYMSGKATPKDPLLVEHYNEMRCAQGKVDACTMLGLEAQRNKDDASATKYFRTACDGADPQGCDLLGRAYENGAGVKIDFPAMLLAYQTACNRQQTWCYDLGRVYDSGIGVKKNQAKAMGLFTQACSAGNSAACAAVRK